MNQEQRAYVMASRVNQASTVQETSFVRLPRPAEGALFVLTVQTASGTIQGIIQKGWRIPATIVHRTTTVGDGGLLGADTDTLEWSDWVSFTTTTTAGTQYLGIVRTTTANASVTTTASMPANQINGGPLGVFYRAAVKLSGTEPQFTYLITGEFEF